MIKKGIHIELPFCRWLDGERNLRGDTFWGDDDSASANRVLTSRQTSKTL
jgi:hypothetical protein